DPELRADSAYLAACRPYLKRTRGLMCDRKECLAMVQVDPTQILAQCYVQGRVGIEAHHRMVGQRDRTLLADRRRVVLADRPAGQEIPHARGCDDAGGDRAEPHSTRRAESASGVR